MGVKMALRHVVSCWLHVDWIDQKMPIERTMKDHPILERHYLVLFIISMKTTADHLNSHDCEQFILVGLQKLQLDRFKNYTTWKSDFPFPKQHRHFNRLCHSGRANTTTWPQGSALQNFFPSHVMSSDVVSLPSARTVYVQAPLRIQSYHRTMNTPSSSEKDQSSRDDPPGPPVEAVTSQSQRTITQEESLALIVGDWLTAYRLRAEREQSPFRPTIDWPPVQLEDDEVEAYLMVVSCLANPMAEEVLVAAAAARLEALADRLW